MFGGPDYNVTKTQK